MQTKQITVGEDYAMADNYEWKRGVTYQYGIYRVRVVEKNAPRQSSGGGSRSWRTVTKFDGIKVLRLEDDGTLMYDREGREQYETVLPVKIRQEWEAFTTARNAAIESRRTQRKTMMATNADRMNRIKEALGVTALDGNTDLPYGVRSLGRTYPDGSSTTKVTLTMGEVAELVEAANKAGYQQSGADYRAAVPG